ncbi:hypothetical protein C1I98_08245 [Spongiactinospora gelatinilytica]|uniref:Uncharacterized protein n=1 Tax=Spongiactinospora gelatinilytica TaxID=2666298 RepID=A0A2W2GUF6_9ACTN|nr:hypothetical protein [Spongiactinospora gelatinilytica]PZG51552.1 hypothetical protein C1I98_08245 [Spongiactinospora gelatinilytica]
MTTAGSAWSRSAATAPSSSSSTSRCSAKWPEEHSISTPISGTVTFQNTRQALAPSTLAASTSGSGTALQLIAGSAHDGSS